MSTVVYCHCANYQLVSEQTRSRVLNALIETGTKFETVGDLCQMAVEKKDKLQSWTANNSQIKIIACFARTVRWLFEYAGACLPKEAEFVNLRTDDIEKVIRSISNEKHRAAKNKTPHFKKNGDWIPWFPVIDYSRCENCKQCFNFCLFGVYELSDDEKVHVVKPRNCKTNCPACARMCPQNAIIFPKYTEAPINGADSSETQLDDKTKINIESILKGDIHQALRQRSKIKERFSPNKTRQPLNIIELQKQLKIPNDVLKSMSASQLSHLKNKTEKNRRD